MTTSPSPDGPSSSTSTGASFSSLPQWRQFLSMLNWRRDPDYEQRKMQHEWRMKQLEIDIVQIEQESKRIEIETEQIEKETEQIERETEQIKKETELLRQENARLRILNAKTQNLLSCVDQLCFPPGSNSTPPSPIEPDCRPSSP
ncbi:MAG: hypothetical protein ACKOOH_07390 [Cyanobium sp.]